LLYFLLCSGLICKDPCFSISGFHAKAAAAFCVRWLSSWSSRTLLYFLLCSGLICKDPCFSISGFHAKKKRTHHILKTMIPLPTGSRWKSYLSFPCSGQASPTLGRPRIDGRASHRSRQDRRQEEPRRW
jgi:hypothetical protein